MRAAREVFLQRAGDEARRYGGDPWVFLRELIQNARDAGAASVEVSTGCGGGREWVEVRDDGEGMDGDRARRFLFTLYASSKRGGSGAAGRFGVGFWSVLRFGPDRLELRSVPASGEGWRVVLDGRLAPLEEGGWTGRPGTTVRLERPGSGAGLSAAVTAAVRETARFVSRRHPPKRVLEVAVDGRSVAEPFSLPSPSLSFTRRGLRAVVALASAPKVELFGFGLKVREAATLEELLGEGRGDRHGAPSRDQPGLAPSILLDSDRLEVLLARGDAREDRQLRRLVGCARRELDRLLRLELDLRSPRGLVARLAERGAALVSDRRARRLALGALIALAGGLILAEGARRLMGSPVPTGASGAVRVAESVPERSYRDLAAAYRGPDVGLGAGELPVVALRYRPADREPLLAALRLDGAALLDPARTGALRPAEGATTGGPAFELTVAIAAGPGILRLPVPTGTAVEPGSVVLDGEPVPLLVTERDEPALVFQNEVSGTLRYRASPPAVGVRVDAPRWPELPESLGAEAVRLARLDPALRTDAAVAVVRERVVYDRSPETAARHRAARQRGGGFLARALSVGAGDCDVQNSVLAALLAASGTPARLAVGYVGQDGEVLPGLHAWVEYLGPDGRWTVADASLAPSTETGSSSAADAGSAAPVGRGRRFEATWAVAIGIVLLGLAAGLATIRARTRRRVDLGDRLDLAAVIRGAIERPEAYAGLAAVERRPLIPCRDGRSLSVARARRLAGQGRLLRAQDPSALERRALEVGAVVVDAGRQEGAAAVDGLGAVDLDWWQRRLNAARPAALETLQERLRGAGVEIRLAAAEPGEPPALLDLEGLGMGRGVVVAVDPRAPAACPADAGSASASLALTVWLEGQLGAGLRLASPGLSRLAQEALEPGDRP